MSKIHKTKYCPICGNKFTYKRQSKKFCGDPCRLAHHRGAPHFLDARVSDFFKAVTGLEDAILDKKFHLNEEEWMRLNVALATLNHIADAPYQKMMNLGD